MIRGQGPENHPNGGRQPRPRGARMGPTKEETAMRKTILRFGLASSAILVALSAAMLPCMNGTVDFEHGEVLGYSTMVLAFLMVFFGVKSYRDNIAGGAIGFGKAFQVGIGITLITCAVYVIAWEITYFNFMPDFLDKYNAH